MAAESVKGILLPRSWKNGMIYIYITMKKVMLLADMQRQGSCAALFKLNINLHGSNYSHYNIIMCMYVFRYVQKWTGWNTGEITSMAGKPWSLRSLPRRSPCSMASRCLPVSGLPPPNGQYVLAIEQGGLPAWWPVHTGH